MTEDSFYWAGTDDGDAGPYAENTMWRNLAQVGIAGNAESDSDLYNIGVFYSVGNQLEVTLDGVNLDVDTGAALVDGAYYENDTAIDITVDAAAAGDERIDYIVLRKCYSGSTYNPGGNVPAVGEQEVRVTVIKGTEVTPPAVPSTPGLTQDTSRATYWDIPLATVEVDDTGATSVTDAREYVDAEMKHFFVSALGGYNSTDATEVSISVLTINPPYPSITLTDNKVVFGNGRFMIPRDYISDMTITAEVWPGAAGNMECDGYAEYRECLENTFHSDTFSKSTVAVTQSLIPDPKPNCVAEITLTNASVNDIVNINFRRYGNDANDNLGQPVYLTGWIIEYLGWCR